MVGGSVRKIGANIRVSAQLIDCQSEGHLWAERYDRPAEEIFGVQDEVASAIAATLEGRIAASGAEFARKKPTKDWPVVNIWGSTTDQGVVVLNEL